ncbi:MAG: tRNA dihydrouridine synthase DusB [Planctomycetota bacterium]|nr:MAG: tRNA dihydrouridine synthase DusB [Planctomycetota bacterium]
MSKLHKNPVSKRTKLIRSAIPDVFRQPSASSATRTEVDRVPFRDALKYGQLPLVSRYLLSPLAGFTTLPFRRIVRRIGGVGLATTDLVNSRALISRNERTMEMVETHPEDRPFAVQIFGSEPKIMADAAQLLVELGVDTIDINMGCPVNRIAGAGAGAGMMCNIDGTLKLVQTVVEAVSIPVSVKMRLGWDSSSLSAPFFARQFEQVGVAAVAIHGRTREQGFGGTVSLPGIRAVVEAVEKIPVIGNGDIRNVADAARMLKETGCHGISIGRAALANPWIFRQLVEWEQTGSYAPAGTFDERLQLMLQQYACLEERHGSERAIIRFRKMAHWYLKGMRILKRLRGDFQQVSSRAEMNAAIAEIQKSGPIDGNRSGVLTDVEIPVPSGPVDKW